MRACLLFIRSAATLPYGVLSFTICIYYMPAFKYAYEQLAADQEGRMKTDIQMVWTNLIF